MGLVVQDTENVMTSQVCATAILGGEETTALSESVQITAVNMEIVIPVPESVTAIIRIHNTIVLSRVQFSVLITVLIMDRALLMGYVLATTDGKDQIVLKKTLKRTVLTTVVSAASVTKKQENVFVSSDIRVRIVDPRVIHLQNPSLLLLSLLFRLL